MPTDLITVRSFVDDEMFICATPLGAEHISTSCKLFPNRYEMLSHLPRQGRVAEIGTQAGKFAKRILATSEPAELHLFDLSFQQKRHPFDHVHFLPSIMAGTTHLHEGDAAEFLVQFPDQYFDWIYVDADHSYEAVARDAELAAKKIKEDGFLAFNDYAVYSPLEKMQYGVMRAVNDMCIKGDFEVVFFAFDIMGYHDICLRRRGYS
jgi:predicted O-methyltransferase YrrM